MVKSNVSFLYNVVQNSYSIKKKVSFLIIHLRFFYLYTIKNIFNIERIKLHSSLNAHNLLTNYYQFSTSAPAIYSYEYIERG